MKYILRKLVLGSVLALGVGVPADLLAAEEIIATLKSSKTAQPKETNPLYHVSLRFRASGGSFGAAKSFVVDTGSTGIVSNYNFLSLTDAEKTSGCQQMGYSSSGRAYYGFLVTRDVQVSSGPGSSNTGNVVASNLPVFAAKYSCTEQVPQSIWDNQDCSGVAQQSSCKLQSTSGASPSTTYMGIAFARKESVSNTVVDHVNESNPLLNLDETGGKTGLPRSYFLWSEQSGTDRELHISLGATLQEVKSWRDQNNHKDPIAMPLSAPNSTTDFGQPRVGYRLLTKAGGTVDLDTTNPNQAVLDMVFTPGFWSKGQGQNWVALANQDAHIGKTVAALKTTGTAAFLPDTGLNTTILSFPISPFCTDVNRKPSATVPVCPDTVTASAECPANSSSSQGKTLSPNTVVQILQPNADGTYSTGATDAEVYHSLVMSASISAKNETGCGRFSINTTPQSDFLLNTGRLIMNDCAWYFNPDAVAQGEAGAWLSCAQ